MFSELRKKLFLSEIGATGSLKRDYEAVFNKTEKYEKKFDKDVCQFSASELQEMIDNMFDVRMNTKKNYIYKLNSYLDWAVSCGIFMAENKLKDIHIDFTTSVKSRMVGNPTQLALILNKSFRPTTDYSMDTIYHAVYWLAFCGVDIDAIRSLTTDNIDLQDMKINFSGKSVRLCADAVSSIRLCMELTQLRVYHPNSKNPDSYTWHDRADGNILLRGTKEKDGIELLTENAGRKIKAANKSGKINCNLTYETVKLSGLFYRIHENEIAGLAPDFHWLAERMSEGKVYKTDTDHSRRAAINRVANTYQKDYESWKNAFYK